MYAVQISKSRKAFRTLTGPTSLNGAYDTYSALVNYQAPQGARVRIVALPGAFEKFTGKPRVLRTAEAMGTSIASLWSR